MACHSTVSCGAFTDILIIIIIASLLPDGAAESSFELLVLQAGMIIDDELNNWLVNPLPQGCKLHCIIDACHSGSVMDLPYRSKIKYGQPTWKNEYAGPTSVWKVCHCSIHQSCMQILSSPWQ